MSDGFDIGELVDALEAAEARADELQRERDKYLEQALVLVGERNEARREADQLRDTLRKVQTYAATNTDDELYAFVTDALAGEQAEERDDQSKAIVRKFLAGR